MTTPSPVYLVSTVRGVAVFECAKGLLVLIAGIGALSLLRMDARLMLESWVAHLHLDLAKNSPRIFADFVADLSDTRLALLALLALVYSMARFVEAYGLWRNRSWAAWFAVSTGTIYIPFELYELYSGAGWPAFFALLINLLIVTLMLTALRKKSTTGGRYSG